MSDLHESQPRPGDEPAAPPLVANTTDPVAAQFEAGEMYARLAVALPLLRTGLAAWLFLGAPTVSVYVFALDHVGDGGLKTAAAVIAMLLFLPALPIPPLLTARWLRSRYSRR